ncbi:MAG: hypothetical protein A2007_01620 [Verrucomicrobia bacterium GWC2_42_7]|nr:MAG: hypothetical protein A2007_01620 [Verrucomicrobia bacterium GWC2_42_7]
MNTNYIYIILSVALAVFSVLWCCVAAFKKSLFWGVVFLAAMIFPFFPIDGVSGVLINIVLLILTTVLVCTGWSLMRWPIILFTVSIVALSVSLITFLATDEGKVLLEQAKSQGHVTIMGRSYEVKFVQQLQEYMNTYMPKH